MELLHKCCFRLRERFRTVVVSPLRKAIWRLQGLTIGASTLPKCRFTWPHKVAIGRHCEIEEDVFFRHDGIWSPGKSIVIGDRVFLGRAVEFNVRAGVSIGDDVLIASGCKFIDHDHGFRNLNFPINRQSGPEQAITIADDVWLGVNVVVLKGVSIGRGAIVAAGAVVNRPIPPFEIWGGIPARRIGSRLPSSGAHGTPPAARTTTG